MEDGIVVYVVIKLSKKICWCGDCIDEFVGGIYGCDLILMVFFVFDDKGKVLVYCVKLIGCIGVYLFGVVNIILLVFGLFV